MAETGVFIRFDLECPLCNGSGAIHVVDIASPHICSFCKGSGETFFYLSEDTLMNLIMLQQNITVSAVELKRLQQALVFTQENLPARPTKH